MSRGRVLIIDDDQMMRNSLVDLTEAAGWKPKALARAPMPTGGSHSSSLTLFCLTFACPTCRGSTFCKASTQDRLWF